MSTQVCLRFGACCHIELFSQMFLTMSKPKEIHTFVKKIHILLMFINGDSCLRVCSITSEANFHLVLLPQVFPLDNLLKFVQNS